MGPIFDKKNGITFPPWLKLQNHEMIELQYILEHYSSIFCSQPIEMAMRIEKAYLGPRHFLFLYLS